MKKRFILHLCLVFTLTSLLSGCSTKNTTAETIIFTDSLGREVTIPTKIHKIAPSGAVATMILYAVAPKKLSSVDRMPDAAYQKFFPKEYLTLPTTGQIYGIADINLEAIIEMAPDLIIDLGDIKNDMAADLDAFQEQTGIPVIFIQATTDTYPEAFRTLGKLLGEEQQGEAMAKFTEETLSRAASNHTSITENNPFSIMFGTGETGLNTNAKGSIHSTVLDEVGVENAIVVAEVSHKGGGNVITMEELMTADPDVILLDVGGPFSTLKNDPYWSGLRAVQENRYYEIPCGPFYFLAGPPSINQIIGIDWLGNLLYPDLYSFSISSRIQEFYKLFWHYDLSDDEVKELIKNSTLKE